MPGKKAHKKAVASRKRGHSPSAENEKTKKRRVEPTAATCSQGACPCTFTTAQLLAAKNARVDKCVVTDPKNPYPKTPVYIVHYDASKEDWMCSSCTHPISIHPASVNVSPQRETTLKQIELIKFTKRSTPNLNILEVYDTNIALPVFAERWYAVRKEYALIFEALCEVVQRKGMKARGLLISGNSGIGKSIGLDDLLRRVLDSRDGLGFLLILVVTVSEDFIFFRKSITESWNAYTCKHVDTEDSVGHFMASVQGVNALKPILVLHDIKNPQGLAFKASLCISVRDTFQATFVVASSPNIENHRGFTESLEGVRKIYCCCWGDDESIELWQLYEKDPTLFAGAFHIIGGVPRYLLHCTTKQFLNDAAKKMQTLSYDQLSAEKNADHSHLIVKLVPSADRSMDLLYTFVSRGIEQLWYEKRKTVDVNVLCEQYQKCVENGLPRRTQGDFYERYVRACLIAQDARSPITLNSLSDDDKKAKMARITNQVVFDGDNASSVTKKSAAGKVTLFVPSNDQFPFVDFLIVDGEDVDLLQCTVKEKHQPTLSTVGKVLDPLKKEGLLVRKLIWVSPPQEGIKKRQKIEGKTSRTDYDAIPQYVCILPPSQ